MEPLTLFDLSAMIVVIAVIFAIADYVARSLGK